MKGYMLYRRDETTALALTCEDDDELLYLLRKLERSRVSWLKNFAKELMVEFFKVTSGEDSCPPAQVVQSNRKNKG